MPTSSAQSDMAALPGMAYTFVTLGLMDNRHANACSRPPLPITHTFISPPSAPKRHQYIILCKHLYPLQSLLRIND